MRLYAIHYGSNELHCPAFVIIWPHMMQPGLGLYLYEVYIGELDTVDRDGEGTLQHLPARAIRPVSSTSSGS